MPVSPARRRTAGDCGTSFAAETEEDCFAADAVDGAGPGVGAEGLAISPVAVAGFFGSALPVVLAVSMVATTWPILTSSPAATFNEILPADSAVPSEVILSVSSSKSG
jgi:hypothetical protein